MGTYRISQLAERSGIPVTTLRFYEDIGLVSADRTAAGYRQYGDHAVDRLEFISSAKLLGLPLDGAAARSLQEVPVVCSLSGAEMGERTEQWQQLVGRATARKAIAGGQQLTFPSEPELAAQLAALATTEQDCCSFFNFTLHLTTAALTLDVRAPEAAAPMVDELFGAAR